MPAGATQSCLSVTSLPLVTDIVEGLLFVTLITTMMKPFHSKMIDRRKRQDSHIGDSHIGE